MSYLPPGGSGRPPEWKTCPDLPKIAAFPLNFTPLLVLKICQKAPGTNIGTYCGHTASLVGLDAFWQLLAVVRVLSVKFPYCAWVHLALWSTDRVSSPASHCSGMWRTTNPRAFLNSSVYAGRNELLFRSLEPIPRELWRETQKTPFFTPIYKVISGRYSGLCRPPFPWSDWAENFSRR